MEWTPSSSVLLEFNTVWPTQLSIAPQRLLIYILTFIAPSWYTSSPELFLRPVFWYGSMKASLCMLLEWSFSGFSQSYMTPWTLCCTAQLSAQCIAPCCYDSIVVIQSLFLWDPFPGLKVLLAVLFLGQPTASFHFHFVIHYTQRLSFWRTLFKSSVACHDWPIAQSVPLLGNRIPFRTVMCCCIIASAAFFIAANFCKAGPELPCVLVSRPHALLSLQ